MAGFAIIIFLALNAANNSYAALPPVKVETITQEISSRLISRDEQFDVTMKIIEADNSSKERSMKILRLSPAKKEHYVLVRMQTPKDLRGTSLLATFKHGKEEKWLYLPSSKQTRRLAASSGESNSILGSELNAEDFNINTEHSAQNTLQKEAVINNQSYYVIESNVGQISSNYSKIVSYISPKEYLPYKSECFDKEGKLLKVIQFEDYKKVADGKWRAGKITIKNVQNNRSTEIALSNIKVNQNLKVADFTPKALGSD